MGSEISSMAVVKRIVIAAFFAIACPHFAMAACVNGHPSVEQEYRDSKFVLVGRATAAKAVPQSKSFYEGTRYTVQVRQTFRGKPVRTIALFSENSSGRFPMETGTDYLLFLSPRPGEPLMVDSCGNSGTVADSSAALAIIKHLSSPKANRR